MEPNWLRIEETAFPPPVRVQTDRQTDGGRQICMYKLYTK